MILDCAKGALRVVLALGLAVFAAAAPAAAFEAADNDAAYFEGGSANIEVRDSDGLLSGYNLQGGVRLGLFWTVFVELGYGTVRYSDTVDVLGAKQQITFRTTGGHIGLGALVPVRNVRLGLKAQQNPKNRWNEEIKDATGVTLSNVSGNIDYTSYFVFVQLGAKGIFEMGARRDLIGSTNSVLENSFGPYLALNIPLN